jgi:uncharacterized alpha-E superfamily protein
MSEILDFQSPSRPMLSRDADSMYWMSRYLAPNLQQRQWRSVLEIMRLDELPPSRDPLAKRIEQYMTFNVDNPSSLLNCLTRARENARSIRETISAEMWECLNTLYWSIRSEEAPQRFEESRDDFYRSIMTGSMLFQGLTHQTLAHDQRWNFAQIAKYLERIDVTARIIETKFGILKSANLETPIRNIHWMATLRSCCAIEAFRRHHLGDMDPFLIASFLILQRDFPRAIRFCVEQAHGAIADIRSSLNVRGVDPAERILGRLTAQLEFAQPDEIMAEGVPLYLHKIQTAVADAAIAIQKTYFLY